MEKKLRTSLQTAVTFLEKHGIRYAVIGGIALSQWGVIRVTRDIDFKVLAPDTNYDKKGKRLAGHRSTVDRAAH